ncbi:hypothetical protein MMIC_P2239 [Mariprofundus micogutta]|uniref:Uncharacterized protein n=1 Tax=Mariprofundus micogutta TaxID=1921010 RepID=A0A1L8CQT5_9PROT|nr:hypothetical protein [Mariprofundus micogutta]GAV21257.1 hypothetical protein MMIC_P2239 [Mariprofundus micogutta]
MSGESHHLSVDTDRLSRQLLVFLICAELFFVVFDIIVNYAEFIEYNSIQRLSNIAREDGLAAWFMTSQTLLAALVLWFLYWLSRNLDGAAAFHRRGWMILALFFTYMSADDGALIHERVGTMIEDMLEKSEQSGEAGALAQWLDMFPSYEWQFLLPFFIAIGLYVLYFLWKVLGVGRPLLMVLAAFSCFGVAVILDFIEGIPADHSLNIYSWLKQAYMLEDYTVDHFAKSLEEFLEMLGISLFLTVFVAQVGRMPNETFSIQCGSSNQSAQG